MDRLNITEHFVVKHESTPSWAGLIIIKYAALKKSIF